MEGSVAYPPPSVCLDLVSGSFWAFGLPTLRGTFRVPNVRHEPLHLTLSTRFSRTLADSLLTRWGFLTPLTPPFPFLSLRSPSLRFSPPLFSLLCRCRVSM